LAYTTPNASQVFTATPTGGDVRWLGSFGHVTDLVTSFICPGGCDQLTCTLEIPVTDRPTALNPGRAVSVIRGGHQTWFGKLDEPVLTSSGWSISAVGVGQQGTDFAAQYTSTWPTSIPDQPINNAISRGLQWANPGVGSPSGMWLGQEVDPAAQTITDLLNLVCTRGALTWYVNSHPGGLPGNDLSVFSLPTMVNRLLVCNSPVPRTLGGDINTIWLRYESAADNATTGASATYALTSVTNAASVTAHGKMEAYIDLSSAAVMTATAAQAVGNQVLARYQRASFAGPFTVQPGQLLNTGGQPVDLGCEQAGKVCRLILCDGSYGAEINLQFPITFIVGAYSYNDQTETATISPYQSLNTSLSGLLSMESTVLTPITVAS
jgi:hypothetical protein